MDRRGFWFWGTVGGTLTLVVVCNTLPPQSARPRLTPPVVTSSALQPTLESAQVEVYLETIRTERQQRELQLTLESLYARQTATADAQRAEKERLAQASTMTAEARKITATAVAWRTTVEAGQAYATATAQAQRVTATANAQRFAHEATVTAAAWAVQATATVEALQATATAQAAAAERTQLLLERERMVNGLQAYAPWGIGGILLVALLGFLAWLAKLLAPRISAVPRDPRGDAKILVIPDGKGGMMILDPDRSFGPALQIVEGQVSQPPLAPPEYQDRVTARDQAVDLTHRGLPAEAARRRPQLPQRLTGILPALGDPASVATAPTIQIIPPEQVRPWLDEVTPKALTTAVEGEIVEENER